MPGRNAYIALHPYCIPAAENCDQKHDSRVVFGMCVQCTFDLVSDPITLSLLVPRSLVLWNLVHGLSSGVLSISAPSVGYVGALLVGPWRLISGAEAIQAKLKPFAGDLRQVLRDRLTRSGSCHLCDCKIGSWL